MKWNAYHIIDFLKIYEQYPALWNMKHKDHCNIEMKAGLFDELYAQLAAEGLLVEMNQEELKSRIRIIEDVYRQELNKVEKSRLWGTGTEEIYSPKLMWFDSAHFLSEDLPTRSSEAIFDLSLVKQEKEPDEVPEPSTSDFPAINGSDKGCEENSWPNGGFTEGCETFSTKSPRGMRSPLLPKKRCQRRAAPKQAPFEIAEAIRYLDRIAQNAADDKPYDQFGKYVAAELRQLPQRQAILLQQEIQNCIIHSKLNCLEPNNFSLADKIATDNISSPSSGSDDTSSTSSMSDKYDSLSDAVIERLRASTHSNV